MQPELQSYTFITTKPTAMLDISFGALFQISIWLCVLFATISYTKGVLRRFNAVISNWHQFIDYIPFTPKEFYVAVQREIQEKKIPHLRFSLITYRQGGLFSQGREYMRVQCKEYIFDVCAAPCASGFFVSYWMGEESDPIADFWKNMPWIGRYFRNRPKTFFELDNEAIFKELISGSIKKVFTELSSLKGSRIIPETYPI